MEIKSHVRAFIRNNLGVTKEQEHTLFDYALDTWLPAPEKVKYLQIIGSTGAGKTRAGRVMEYICANPVFVTGSMTSRAIIAAVEENSPCTLILDEEHLTDNDLEFSNILIAGTSRNARVTRMNHGEPEQHNFFGYKVFLSTSEFIYHSLQARSIIVRLNSDYIQSLPRVQEFESEGQRIKEMVADYFLSMLPQVKNNQPSTIAGD